MHGMDDIPQGIKDYLRKIGAEGGHARARALTKQRRREIALKAVWAREKKRRDKS